MKKINHWINGKNVAGADYFHTTNPATGEVLAEVASGGEAEINQAVAAAKELLELVRASGDRADYPDNIYGYGVPDMWKAYNSYKLKMK